MKRLLLPFLLFLSPPFHADAAGPFTSQVLSSALLYPGTYEVKSYGTSSLQHNLPTFLKCTNADICRGKLIQDGHVIYNYGCPTSNNPMTVEVCINQFNQYVQRDLPNLRSLSRVEYTVDSASWGYGIRTSFMPQQLPPTCDIRATVNNMTIDLGQYTVNTGKKNRTVNDLLELKCTGTVNVIVTATNFDPKVLQVRIPPQIAGGKDGWYGVQRNTPVPVKSEFTIQLDGRTVGAKTHTVIYTVSIM